MVLYPFSRHFPFVNVIYIKGMCMHNENMSPLNFEKKYEGKFVHYIDIRLDLIKKWNE